MSGFKNMNKNEVILCVTRLLNDINAIFEIDDCNITIHKGFYDIGLQFEFWDGTESGVTKEEINKFACVTIWVYESKNNDSEIYNTIIDGDDVTEEKLKEELEQVLELTSSMIKKIGYLRSIITDVYEFAKENEIETEIVDDIFCKISAIYENN